MPSRESQLASCWIAALLAGCAAAPARARPDAGSDATAETRDGGGDRSPIPADGAVPVDVEPQPDAAVEVDAEVDAGDPPMLTSNGCAAGACLNPACQPLGTPAAPGRFLEVGFESRAAYLPEDVVIPTLDDAPDGVWSGALLDWLDASGVHADFFLNSAHRCDAGAQPDCAAVLERVLRSQNPGNHTAHHLHLGTDCRALEVGGPRACEDELTEVESLVQVLSNGGIGHLSRFRAPYGEPFQQGGPVLSELQSVVARFAVHVGWAIDAGDGDAGGGSLDGPTAVANVASALGDGPGRRSWGIVRLPATMSWSLEVVRSLLDPRTGYLPTHHFRAGTVEDAICWKYGRHSWELVSQITGHRVGEN
jgi:peptidoglycan/xylan/chitin deacetylase (PgdA/CDA1 family)